MAKVYVNGKCVEADKEYVEYVKAAKTIADMFYETLKEKRKKKVS